MTFDDWWDENYSPSTDPAYRHVARAAWKAARKGLGRPRREPDALAHCDTCDQMTDHAARSRGGLRCLPCDRRRARDRYHARKFWEGK